MGRIAIPEATVTQVIMRSRRRCCVCFGLHRDGDLKKGQIAHIDRTNTNNREDNLAYLCLEHHDAYDSKNSQSKGFTPLELKAYRTELDHFLGSALSQQVHFGKLHIPPNDPLAGQYIRIGTGIDSSEIVLTPLPDSAEQIARYFVSGFAIVGAEREFGPNMGECGFVLEIEEGRSAHYSAQDGHRMVFTFEEGILLVHEEGEMGIYGMGVTFDGTYRRVR